MANPTFVAMEEQVTKLLNNKVITDYVKNSQIIKKGMKPLVVLNRYLFVICMKAEVQPTSNLTITCIPIKKQLSILEEPHEIDEDIE